MILRMVLSSVELTPLLRVFDTALLPTPLPYFHTSLSDVPEHAEFSAEWSQAALRETSSIDKTGGRIWVCRSKDDSQSRFEIV